LLLAAQPEPVTPVLQVLQHLVNRHLPGHAGLKADEGHSGAVTPIQRFESHANLNGKPGRWTLAAARSRPLPR